MVFLVEGLPGLLELLGSLYVVGLLVVTAKLMVVETPAVNVI